MANPTGKKMGFRDDQVREIRRMATVAPEGGRKLTYTEIGAKFGVSAVTIHSIVRGKSYCDVAATDPVRS